MINIIFDLDETLIHTLDITPDYVAEYAKSSDLYFKIDGNYYWIMKRPGLDLFLEFIFKYFNVGIWTAGEKEYAKEICKRILTRPQLHRIRFIYRRNFCHLDSSTNPAMFTKPLIKIFELFPNFKPNNTLMIDNTYNVMKYNPQNAVEISDFTGDPNDRYLYHIRNIIVKYYQNIRIDSPIWGLIYHLNTYLNVL